MTFPRHIFSPCPRRGPWIPLTAPLKPCTPGYDYKPSKHKNIVMIPYKRLRKLFAKYQNIWHEICLENILSSIIGKMFLKRFLNIVGLMKIVLQCFTNISFKYAKKTYKVFVLTLRNVFKRHF